MYTSPFEVVHGDLWGPSRNPSSCDYSYYMTFVDTYTKFTWIYFLKHKSDALNAFKQFLARVKTQFSTTIKALQTDRGGEYKPFAKYLSDLGIWHRLTYPHTSHQNGTIERKHRLIVEMGFTVLAHSSLPLSY